MKNNLIWNEWILDDKKQLGLSIKGRKESHVGNYNFTIHNYDNVNSYQLSIFTPSFHLGFNNFSSINEATNFADDFYKHIRN